MILLHHYYDEIHIAEDYPNLLPLYNLNEREVTIKSVVTIFIVVSLSGFIKYYFMGNIQ
jgi:hypothetical protein